jgi:hypothetical protein
MMLLRPFVVPGTHPFDFAADHTMVGHRFDNIDFVGFQELLDWRMEGNCTVPLVG